MIEMIIEKKSLFVNKCVLTKSPKYSKIRAGLSNKRFISFLQNSTVLEKKP